MPSFKPSNNVVTPETYLNADYNTLFTIIAYADNGNVVLSDGKRKVCLKPSALVERPVWKKVSNVSRVRLSANLQK